MAYVGEKREDNAFVLNRVANVVITIVRHAERRYAESACLERLALHYIMAVCLRKLHLHAVVAVHTRVYKLSGIDGQIELLAEASYRLDMVGMVVRNKNRTKSAEHVQPVIAETFLQTSRSYTNINQESVVFCI